MQPGAYFNSAGYQTAFYGQGTTYDINNLKCPNTAYPDSPENTFGNLATSNFSVKTPQSYSDAAFHQPGLLQNCSHVCYKTGSKQYADYGKPDILSGIKSVIQGNEYILQEQEKNIFEHPVASESSVDISKCSSNSYIGNQSTENDKWHKLASPKTGTKNFNDIESAPLNTEKNSNDTSEISQTKSHPLCQDNADTERSEQETVATDSKPTLSYIALIGKSILESPQKRLSLGSIYSWIEKHYPYYKNKGQGWRNSVRHNLSLNDCFIKAGRCEDGKGNYWAVHPSNIQDFMKGDFRQRRRSRRRGRKKDSELGLFQLPNGYLGNTTPSLTLSALNPASSLSTMYAPYTEAERRAYRLDEALLRQSMQNPLMNWYNNVACTSYNAVGGTSGECGAMYTSNPAQWQGYNDVSPHAGIYPVNSAFSR